MLTCMTVCLLTKLSFLQLQGIPLPKEPSGGGRGLERAAHQTMKESSNSSDLRRVKFRKNLCDVVFGRQKEDWVYSV
jgi:hypothetical protein